jgi:hypothetical protein
MTQYTAQEALDKRQKKAKGETKDGKYAGQEQSDLEVCVCLVVCSHGALKFSYFAAVSKIPLRPNMTKF